jgi:hypothetical protein
MGLLVSGNDQVVINGFLWRRQLRDQPSEQAKKHRVIAHMAPADLTRIGPERKSPFSRAAESNQLALVRWLHHHRVFDPSALSEGAKYFQMTRTMLRRGDHPPRFSDSVANGAI